MKDFLDKDFLLQSEPAKILYHQYAKDMPIFDFHCHLNPKEIADNIRLGSITQAWLAEDHYKWRQIRTNGMDEKAGDDWQKFYNWSDTVAHLVGNPLYHWTHLELQRYFNISTPLSAKTAEEIYNTANKELSENPELNVYGIFKKFNVYAVGTTDDPIDSLEYHVAAKANGCPTKIIPSFRPEKAISIDADFFVSYIEKLASISEMKIENACDVVQALFKRLDYFIDRGCLATDVSIVNIPYALASEETVNKIFKKAVNGERIDNIEAEQYKTYVLLALAEQYAKKGVVMQLHIQPTRNNNTRIYREFGPDQGCDATADNNLSYNLSRFLDTLELKDALPKTILYSLNPNDYNVIGSVMGAFQKDLPGKIQLGAAWWFNDHRDGMEEQMKILGNLGMLSRFVGMLTDSRSFLSYPRHEYFRRILCNLLGSWMEAGEIPGDYDFIGSMVQDISFNNAKKYFG